MGGVGGGRNALATTTTTFSQEMSETKRLARTSQINLLQEKTANGGLVFSFWNSRS